MHAKDDVALSVLYYYIYIKGFAYVELYWQFFPFRLFIIE